MSHAPLRFVSQLDASLDSVWASISTMDGVNYELSPILRMTYPKQAAGLRLEDAPLQICAFQSYLLLLGLLPFDRHALTLVEVTPRAGFLEESKSLLQRRWRHERRLVKADSGGCVLSDELLFVPRVWFMAPLVERIVTMLFNHRHARLHARFGGTRL